MGYLLLLLALLSPLKEILKNVKHLSPLLRVGLIFLEPLAPLSHFPDVEVQDKERGRVCPQRPQFPRDTLCPTQTTLINRGVFLKPAQLFWLTALGIIFEMIDYVKS